MKIYSNAQHKHFRAVMAAGEDEDLNAPDFEDVDFQDEEVTDTIDDMADNIEDMKDQIDEDVVEDDTTIEVDNNIDDHYIAECDICHGIFISAVTESDQDVQSITGVCPLCGKESDQYLNWVVKPRE